MKKTIYIFTIRLLLTSSFFLFLSPSFAQTQSQLQAGKKIMKKGLEEKQKAPLYNGTSIGVDAYGIGAKFFGSNFLSSEVSVDVNLKHRFFPLIEAGYGTTNTTNDKGIHYQSSAPFARIGMDYNTMYKKKTNSYLFAGLRYGFTAFKYDVSSPDLKDGIWQGKIPFSYSGEKSKAQWLELALGVKAEIFKNFQMGWSLRYKIRLSVKENANTDPWYIPGFGENNASTLGVTYNLIYKLPFR